jgi:hypothetical protein
MTGSATAFLRRRWPAVALVASLVLNGFLIGMIVADSLKPRRGGFSGERLAGIELRRLDDRLPPGAVDRISAEVRQLAPALDERIKTVRTMREEIMRLAAEPDPDRQAIEERLEALRVEGAAMQREVQDATYDALLKLPPDERASLANRPG